MLEGEIHQINLVERLIELWREKFTGALRFENDGIIKIIYFKEGDILSASTNDRADSVDEILMKAGKVSREHVKQALAKRKENETLGDALLNLGFITRKELAWGRRVQVVNVIRSISEWSAGSFTIVADYLPKREEGTIFPLPQIIVELIVTDQDRQKFEKLLDSGSAVFEKGSDFEQFKALGLNEDAEKIVAQVDGSRTASEVAESSRQETFNAFKLLHALSLLGILHKKADVVAIPGLLTDSFESAGVADAADAWSVSMPMPKFDLDDAPPVVAAPIPEPQPQTAMPSWDSSAALDIAAPAEASAFPSPAPADEWGFDEAQVEAARKVYTPPAPIPASSPVATPPPRRTTVSGTGTSGTATMSGTQTRRKMASPPPKKKSNFGLILAVMIAFIVAGVVYGGYVWWKGRGTPSAVVATPPVAEPKPTGTQPPAVVTKTETDTITATVGEAPKTQPVDRRPPRPATTTTVATTKAAAPTTPPASARATDVQSRYASMAREFAASPGASFTVQFAIVCEASNVTKALNSGGTNVWFLPITIKERPCYRLMWGRYATRDEAERGLQAVPASLRESRPAVVSVPR